MVETTSEWSHQNDVTSSFATYLRARQAAMEPACRFRGSDAAAWPAFAPVARTRLRARLGLAPRVDSPPRFQRGVVSEEHGVITERLVYETRPGLLAVGYLLRRSELHVPAPTVLCPPGHGQGVKSVLFEQNETYKQYPLELARRGFVAFVPEHLGFGERTLDAGHHAFTYHALNLLGESAQGYYVSDLERALDLLQALPEVDRERIGCYGLSLGGELTLLLAACDERVKVAAISGFLTSYAATFLDVGHCGCGYVFGLAQDFEHQDIAALIAPRPLYVETGRRDGSFPWQAAVASVAWVRGVYSLLGCPDRLEHRLFDGEHEVERDSRAIEWLSRHL